MIKGFVKNLNLFFLTQGMTFVFAASLPSKIDNTRFSGMGRRVLIKKPMVNPAFAAYEDSFALNTLTTENKKANFESIESGQEFVPHVYSEEKLAPVLIKVSQVDPMESYKSLTPIRISSPVQNQSLEMAMWVEGQIVKAERKAPLVREKVLAMNYDSEDLESDDWAEESYRTKVQKLLGAELANSSNNNFRQVATNQGSPILVMANTTPKTHSKTPEKAAAGKKINFKDLAQTDIYSGLKDILVPGDQSTSDIQPTSTEKDYPYWVSGPIRFSGGLAYSPDHHKVDIYRSYMGQVFDIGEVHIWEAEYTIRVNEAKGQIVVEVRGRNGEIVGMGQYDLDGLPKIAQNKDKVENVEINIHPIESGIKGQVVSAYSYRQNEIKMSQSKVYDPATEEFLTVNEQAEFLRTNVAERSASSMEVLSEKHWGTIKEVLTGEPTVVQLFSEKYIESLAKIILPDAEAKTLSSYGVIMGKVMHSGEPEQNIQIELSGVDQKPVYFETLLPSQNLESTGESGEFVFMLVPPGEYFIRAKRGGEVFPAELIRVEAGFVNYKELNTDLVSRINIELVDGLTGDALDGEVKYAGTNEALSVRGQEEILAPSGEGQVILEADLGQDYVFSSYRFSKKSHYNQLKGVQKKWLIDLLEQSDDITHQIDFNKNNFIVGFVENSAGYEIQAKSLNRNSAKSQTIYFDHEGRRVDSPAAQGGFIILGLEDSSYHISLIDSHSNEHYSQFVKMHEPSAPILTVTFKGAE